MVNWGFYKALYDVDYKQDLRVEPKLTRPHINPGPFEKMVVSYATQVRSQVLTPYFQIYLLCKYGY